VRAAARSLGVDYPIAVDSNYKTWDAWNNEYWPADYLIDADGDVRHVSFGEGAYGVTEDLIRKLLSAAHPGLILPRPTDVPNKTPTETINPETYVGYERLEYLAPSENIVMNEAAVYRLPSDLQLGQLGFGGTWTEHSEEATAGSRASLELGFVADDVYLVIGGTGTVRVSVDGRAEKTVIVKGIPDLYTIYRDSDDQSGTLLLRFSPGLEAYDFTFG
jgi:hypothetical protein